MIIRPCNFRSSSNLLRHGRLAFLTTSVFALLASLGCAAPGATSSSQPSWSNVDGSNKPDWVDHPSAQPRFPQDRFVTATGCTAVKGLSDSELRLKTDSAARAVVALQVAGHIRATLLDDERSERRGSGADVSERVVHQRIDQTVHDFDLANIAIEDHWRDRSTACALGVLEKAKTIQLESSKAAELLRTSSEHLAKGDAVAATEPGSTLREYLRASIDAERAVGSNALVRALGGNTGQMASSTDALERLTTLASGLSLVVVSGADQRVRDGKALSRPIVLVASAAGVPVTGLPIKVRLDGGRVPSRLSTDPTGQAVVRVDSVGPFNTQEKVLTAGLDWTRLSEEKEPPTWVVSLKPVEAQTTIQRLTRESIRVVVNVSERIMRSPDGTDPVAVTEPPVHGAIMKALGQAGIHPKEVQDSAVGLTDRINLSIDEITKRISHSADYAIIGSATSRESGKYGTKTVWHRARAELRVIDLGTNQVVTSLNLEVKGREPDFPEKAGRIALETLAEKVGPAITANFVKVIDR